MNEYQLIIDQFERLKSQQRKILGLQDFALRIEDFTFKSPQATSYGIQIPLQYIRMIELICNLILANLNTFKQIGWWELEATDKAYKVNSKILTVEEFKALNNLDKDSNAYHPIDRKREDFAKFLSQFILSFFCYHELGHVRQLNLSQQLQETNIEFKDNENSSHLDNQAEEVDADVFGINFFLQHLFTLIDNFDELRLYRLFSSRREILHSAIFALMILFYISDSDDQIYDPNKDHPHPIVRLDYISSLMQEMCVINQFVLDKAEFSKLMLSVIKDFDITLTHVFGIENNKLYYNKFNDPDVKGTEKKLVELIQKDKFLNFNNRYSSD